MKNIQDILKKLASPIGESPYSVTGVARKRYILGEVVIENVLQSQVGIVNNDLSDIDKINLDKVIDAYNKSNNGYKSRTINNGNAIVDSGVVYEPNTIDKATYVKTNILNGGVQGVYDGGKSYVYGFENVVSNIGLYSTRINISKNVGYPDLTQEEKARVEELLQRIDEINADNDATNRDTINIVKNSYIKNYDELIKIYTDHFIEYNIPVTDRYNTLVTKRSLVKLGFTSLVYAVNEGSMQGWTHYNVLTNTKSNVQIMEDFTETAVKEACIKYNNNIFDAYDTASKNLVKELERMHKEELAKPVGAGTQDNYMTNVINLHLRQIKQLYPLMSQKAIDVINSDVLSYCYAIEAIHKMMIDNINTLEFNITVGGTITEVSSNNSYGVDLTFERSRFLDFLKRSLNNIKTYTKYFEGFKPAVVTAPQNIVVNEVVTTSNCLKRIQLMLNYLMLILTLEILIHLTSFTMRSCLHLRAEARMLQYQKKVLMFL